jgi:hypothetical protein
LIAPLYSVSSIARHERDIQEVAVSKLKSRLQKAAESGETLDIMKYFSLLSFVCNVLSSFVLTETDQEAFTYRMLLVNWPLEDNLMHWIQTVILSPIG